MIYLVIIAKAQCRTFRKTFLPPGDTMKKLAVFLFFVLAIFHAYHARAAQILGNPSPLAQSTTAESSHVFKATPGYIYGLGATTSAGGFLLVYDAATAPSNGAVTPIWCEQIATNSTQWFSFNSMPIPTATGITFAFSSTGCFTQTLANAFFQAQVR